MSVEENTTSGAVPATTGPDGAFAPSANYMPCEHCGEGTLVYDPDLRASRCRACGEAALPEVGR
jgi:ribosomal protein S27E